MSEISENNKRIAEIILSDIMNDAPIANILLKVKIYATKRDDAELLEWVNAELNGYEDAPPRYRIIPSRVKVDIHRGVQVVLDQEYPIDLVEDNHIRKRLSQIPVHNSITEIAELYRKESGLISVEIPTAIWYHHMGHCINGNIQRAYQYTDISALSSIITSVKSLLIEFFSKVDENNEIDFSSVMRSKESVVMNYNAAIINTGDGTVNASNVTNVVGDNNTISISTIDELKDILQAINSLMGSSSVEFDEVSEELSGELSKSSPTKKILKRGFQAIKGLALSASSEVLSGQIALLLEKALGLLQ